MRCRVLQSGAAVAALIDMLISGRGMIEQVANIYELFGHKVRRQEGRNPWRRWWADSSRWGAFSDILHNPMDALQFVPAGWSLDINGSIGNHLVHNSHGFTVGIMSHLATAEELRRLKKRGEFQRYVASGPDLAGCILAVAVLAEVERQRRAACAEQPKRTQRVLR